MTDGLRLHALESAEVQAIVFFVVTTIERATGNYSVTPEHRDLAEAKMLAAVRATEAHRQSLRDEAIVRDLFGLPEHSAMAAFAVKTAADAIKAAREAE